MKIKNIFHYPHFSKSQFYLLIILVFILITGLSAILITRNTNIIFPVYVAIFPVVFLFRFKKINLSYLNLGFGLLFLEELVALIFSGDFLNSFEAFNRFIVILLMYFLYRMVNYEFKNISIIHTGFFLVSIILMIISALSFISFKNDVSALGFENLTQFKYLYHPLKLLKINTFTNLWASALIIFLVINSVFFFKQKNKIWTAVIGFGILLNIFCLLATLSRGAYLAFIVFWLLVNLFFIKRVKFKKIVLINVVVFAMVLFSAVLVGNSMQTTLAFSKTVSQQRSTSGRFVVWKNGLKMVGEKPVFGQGQKNYKLAFEKKPIIAEDAVFPIRTNNTYLQLIIERGIFGLILYASFAFLILFITLKNLQNKKQTHEHRISVLLLFAGIVALLVRELTFSTFFDNDMINFLSFYLFFNMVPYDVSIKKIKINKKQRSSLLWCLTAVIFLISLLNILKWQGEKYNNKFVTHYLKNETDESILMLDKAIVLSPEKYELNRHKAFAISKNAFGIGISANNERLLEITVYDFDALKKAVTYFQKALQKRPDNLETLQNLGWVYWALGNTMVAEKYFLLALEKNEYNIISLSGIFLLNINNNRLEEATYTLAKMLRYAPSVLESKLYLEFSKMFPLYAKQAKSRAIFELSEIISTKNNYIYKARLARLILNENPEKACQLLKSVTLAMPGLKHPWIYKGYLKSNEKKTKEKEAANDFLTGLFLSESDFQSLKYYANYLRLQSDHKNAVKLHKQALLSSIQPKTIHFKKNTGIANLKEIFTSEIMENLAYYTNPMINASEIFSYFSDYYYKNNDNEKGEYYKFLSLKYTNRIYKGEDILK